MKKKENQVGFISGFGGSNVYVRDIENNSLQTSSTHKQINPNNLKLISRNNNWVYGINI